MHTRQLFDLSGRVAIVTGGSVGLGRQMAQGLAEMGANVVLCARKKERCEAAAEELRKLGVKSAALGCDGCGVRSHRRADQQRRDCLGSAGGGDAA